MNTSINTLKRVQRMHANFAALNLNAEEGGMGDEPPDIGEEGMVDEVIEIILHTLFESGVTRIQDLERYIKDNVVWHELRLVDLEKKLVGAYRETVKTQVEILNDDALFAGEDDESAFVMGGFSDTLGDSFLRLREPGIAAELGSLSLTIPKKLLRETMRSSRGYYRVPKPKEPPPPYPPLPPSLPITSKNVGDQIGLLRPSLWTRRPLLKSLHFQIGLCLVALILSRWGFQRCAFVTSDIAFHAISIFSP
ncbi:uncharacterized protein F5891DRAFT_1254828 [Suillus fuscotomentosus]|uniref:Uncharacterized protein n=1 Tax=Suillus fuscotomentosus TaxID=1912939 RepID=A0AAD4DXH8_9AGAM|nr:uncharacterized protein F5891DRAFT_1254828 [Suillus fuscotomentosus]KAG1894679.1 hypothetical protein F5891DRAFT_1254828 [Suillus fuscotomentosus]